MQAGQAAVSSWQGRRRQHSAVILTVTRHWSIIRYPTKRFNQFLSSFLTRWHRMTSTLSTFSEPGTRYWVAGAQLHVSCLRFFALCFRCLLLRTSARWQNILEWQFWWNQARLLWNIKSCAVAWWRTRNQDWAISNTKWAASALLNASCVCVCVYVCVCVCVCCVFVVCCVLCVMCYVLCVMLV